MAVTFYWENWGDIGITSRYRYANVSSASGWNYAASHMYQKRLQLGACCGEVNNPVLDTSTLTGPGGLTDGPYTSVALTRQTSDLNANGCRYTTVDYTVTGGAIDPATLVINFKGWGGWMAGDVVEIGSTGYTCTILSGDPSIAFVYDHNDASNSSGALSWFLGIDRRAGDEFYKNGYRLYWDNYSDDQMRCYAYTNWSTKDSNNFGYGQFSHALSDMYRVWEADDYQAVVSTSRYRITSCPDTDNTFWMFSGNNPDSVSDQNDYEWGFIRLKRPAGQTYTSVTQPWVFVYWLPNTAGDAADVMAYTRMRMMQVSYNGLEASTNPIDLEVPFGYNAGYLLRNQPVFGYEGLIGYMPDGLGFSQTYSAEDEMTDGTDTWKKHGRVIWVKDQ